MGEVVLRSIAVAPSLGLLRHGLVEAILRRRLCIRSHGDHSVVERYQWGITGSKTQGNWMLMGKANGIEGG
jgi:hypothetical protein